MSDELPVVPGETIGWKGWTIVKTSYGAPRLSSPVKPTVWPTDDWLEGPCIHAARTRELLNDMGYNGRAKWWQIDAVGEVGLAGRIEPGDWGFIAERARVVSIILPYRLWRLLDDLRDAYRVPVTLGNLLVGPEGAHSGHRT